MTTTGLPGTILAFLAKWITVLVFTGSLLVELSAGQNVTDAKDLRTLLFVTDAYDYRVRPVSNQSQRIGTTIVLFFFHSFVLCFIFHSFFHSLLSASFLPSLSFIHSLVFKIMIVADCLRHLLSQFSMYFLVFVLLFMFYFCDILQEWYLYRLQSANNR